MTRFEMLEAISSKLHDGECLIVWCSHKCIKGRNMAIAVDGADCYEIDSHGYRWSCHKWRHGGDLRYHYYKLVVEPRKRRQSSFLSAEVTVNA